MPTTRGPVLDPRGRARAASARADAPPPAAPPGPAQRPAPTGRVLWLAVEPAAPPKPGLGEPCNGCGLCCLAEPCPLGRLLSRRRHGACVALRWEAGAQRYGCGALTRFRHPLWRRLVARWIAAGAGCDADFDAPTLPVVPGVPPVPDAPKAPGAPPPD